MVKSNQHKAFWLLAGPMIISNISLALLGLVDTAVIGHLDSAVYLGGVAVGTVIFDFLYWGMGFLRMGTTGIVAQALGQHDATEVRTTLVRSVVLGFAVALIAIILHQPIFTLGLSLLAGSDEVKHYAMIYCQWMIWGMPALMFLFSVNGWLLGLQHAMTVLKLGVIVNLINIILDIVFVIFMDMGVGGVALASVISQYSGALFSLFIIRKHLFEQGGEWLFEKIMDLKKLKGFINLNHAIFVRTICIILVFSFFTRESAVYGDTVLAANSILLKLYLFMALALDGFNHAAEALVGRAIGQQNRHLFDQVVSLTLKWSFAFGLFFSFIYLFLGNDIIRLLTNIDLVRQSAMVYLPWMIAMPLVSVWCFLLDGIFLGATRAAEMRNSMIVCTTFFFVSFIGFLQTGGNHGLWFAFTLFATARGLSLALYYFQIERKTGFIVQ